MAKTQNIRHMPSHFMSARFSSSPRKINPDRISLKVFDPGRSGQTKFHRSRANPVSKTREANEKQTQRVVEDFPAEQWQELSKSLHSFRERVNGLNDDRFDRALVKLGMSDATESRISDLKRPLPLTKALKATFNDRHYRGIPMAKVLGNKLEEMLGKSVEGRKKRKPVIEKRDLAQKVSFQKEAEPAKEINVLDWLENLFAEPALKKSFKQSIHQLESGVNDFSASVDKKKALKVKSTYGQGNFFELRTELAFEYLKAKDEIVDYKRTVPNSYLDHLGIDFLIRVKVDGQTKILAAQVKSSSSNAKDFYKPKQLSMYNFRQRQPLDTENQRKGIMLINMDKKTLSDTADEVSELILSKKLRAEKGIALMPDFNFREGLDLEKLKSWYQMLENNLVENHVLEKQSQHVA